jgi:hypothetical protein
MITPITSIARLARQTRAVSVPLLVAGALAAGCGTSAAHSGGPTVPVGAGGTTSASSSASAPGSTQAPSATPVPTVTGGAVTAGDVACAGWPSNAPHGRLTAYFQPVTAERCVTGFQEIAGKGEWETATLEKSTDSLAGLVEALLAPSGARQPGVFCPEFVVIPPQVLLISSTGKLLIPRLPVSACGIADARVLTTLDAMSWQPVSVRLVNKVAPTLPGASIGPGSPKMLKTLVAVPPAN